MVSAYYPWTTALWQFPPPPHERLPGNYPLNFSHGQLPLYNEPLDKCSLWNILGAITPWIFAPADNYLWIVFPCPVIFMKFLTGQLPPGRLPFKHLFLNKSFLNKWQRTFALENYPWIIYRCRLKKVLFTHFSSEISNKFWKKLSKGLCILLRGDILLRGNPFFQWIKRKY